MGPHYWPGLLITAFFCRRLLFRSALLAPGTRRICMYIWLLISFIKSEADVDMFECVQEAVIGPPKAASPSPLLAFRQGVPIINKRFSDSYSSFCSTCWFDYYYGGAAKSAPTVSPVLVRPLVCVLAKAFLQSCGANSQQLPIAPDGYCGSWLLGTLLEVDLAEVFKSATRPRLLPDLGSTNLRSVRCSCGNHQGIQIEICIYEQNHLFVERKSQLQGYRILGSRGRYPWRTR